MSEALRDIAVRYAWSLVGTPYRWGGDDPLAGFDCSGFVIEVLKGVGLLPEDFDTTAHGLWVMYRQRRHGVPAPGRLVFYGEPERVVHVMFAVSAEVVVGASGGGSRTRTFEDAVRQDAFVKVRPVMYRPDFVGCADPFEQA